MPVCICFPSFTLFIFQIMERLLAPLAVNNKKKLSLLKGYAIKEKVESHWFYQLI